MRITLSLVEYYEIEVCVILSYYEYFFFTSPRNDDVKEVDEVR